MTAQTLADRITQQITDTIISKSSGLSAEECMEALGIIEDFCYEWAQTIKAEEQRRMTAKQIVLKEFPSAWFNAKERAIEGYSHGLILGRGSVLARSVEDSAWRDAAKRLRTRRAGCSG